MLFKIILWFFERKAINQSERMRILNLLITKLPALPLRNIIRISAEGALIVNDKEVDREKMVLLRESAKTALSNEADQLVEDQVLYQALSFAANTSINFEQLYFGKAAVWWGQERRKLLETLANFSENPDLAG